MFIKILGLSLAQYVRDKFNLFDAFIVTLSTIELILEFSISTEEEASQSNSAISVFRGLRILRLFKLAKKMKKL